ncbi:hypothetical protein Y032_0018g3486 [Ancylostoma ceylanicum]|nr:hypothetical protein Y032_0018g3486 [Ancylostoma ceylanicum]
MARSTKRSRRQLRASENLLEHRRISERRTATVLASARSKHRPAVYALSFKKIVKHAKNWHFARTKVIRFEIQQFGAAQKKARKEKQERKR